LIWFQDHFSKFGFDDAEQIDKNLGKKLKRDDGTEVVRRVIIPVVIIAY
jgi:hypothetical protein